MNKILIIDGHALAFLLIHISVKSNPPNIFEYWKYLMYYNIMGKIEKFKPSRVVIVFDSGNCWRKSVYPNYKANRKNPNIKLKYDQKEFYKHFDDFVNEFKSLFTTIFILKVDTTEGDDIIAIITKHEKNSKIVIVSRDSDFIQLLTNPNVILYDPMKNKEIKSINPEMYLKMKILRGDKNSDFIPPIQRGIGVVKAEKIVTSGLDEYLKELSEKHQDETLQNYQRNKQLIDFKFIPIDLQQKILDTYINYKLEPIDELKLLQILAINNFKYFNHTFEQISKTLNKLN